MEYIYDHKAHIPPNLLPAPLLYSFLIPLRNLSFYFQNHIRNTAVQKRISRRILMESCLHMCVYILEFCVWEMLIFCYAWSVQYRIICYWIVVLRLCKVFIFLIIFNFLIIFYIIFQLLFQLLLYILLYIFQLLIL